MKKHITILKVIATYLVIVIHIISRTWNSVGVNTDSFKLLTLVDSFCRCAVPIFLMCSGAIFINRDDSYKKIIFKYILKIYLIFLLWNSIYLLFKLVILENNMISLLLLKNVLISSLKFETVYQFWFLKVIIICYLFIPIFRIVKKKNSFLLDIFILLVLSILFVEFPKVGCIININYNLRYLLYFYFGYFFNKYHNIILNIICFILSILGIIYMYKKTLLVSNIELIPNEYYLSYLSLSVVIVSIFVFITFVNVSKYLKLLYKFLSFQYKYTLGIYIIHGLVIGFLDKVKIIDIYNITSILKIIISSSLVYVFSLLIVYIYYLIKDKLLGVKK